MALRTAGLVVSCEENLAELSFAVLTLEAGLVEELAHREETVVREGLLAGGAQLG